MDDSEKKPHPAEPVLAALGMVTIAWSGLQLSIEMVIWEFLNVDYKKGRIITSQMTSLALIEMLQTICHETYAKHKDIAEDYKILRQTIENMKSLNSKRNDIMHSEWRLNSTTDVRALKSSRHLAKGKLHTRSKDWTKEDLETLAGEMVNVSSALIQLAEQLQKFKDENKGAKYGPKIQGPQ